jgi:hypothetical protein
MYAFFDGDSIGDKMEIMLLENRLTEAAEFSEKLENAMSQLDEIVKSQEGVEIIILGGDDLLFKYQDDSKNILEYLEKIRSEFHRITGSTMSCGVGETVRESVINLYFAKLYGKNQIKFPDVKGKTS